MVPKTVLFFFKSKIIVLCDKKKRQILNEVLKWLFGLLVVNGAVK